MRNIMLVEDDTETTRLLQLYFHSELYHLFCCSNGKDALEKLANSPFNHVILDISLPDMTGLEICQQLRQDGFTIPIIMLTSRIEETDKV